MTDKKVVLITGGAGGQGRSHALEFARHGYTIVLADLLEPTDSAYQETVNALQGLGSQVLIQKTNICDSRDVQALFDKTWNTFGRLDVVIANAGIVDYGLTWEITDAQMEKVIGINLIGTWRTNKYAALKMLSQGFGRIINISSISGLHGTPTLGAYCMSKWGIMGLTETIAHEVQSSGIIVNAVCPTGVKTKMCESQAYVDNFNKMMGSNFHDYHEMYETGGFLDPEEITKIVFWLADSPEAGLFTGRHIIVDKGTTP